MGRIGQYSIEKKDKVWEGRKRLCKERENRARRRKRKRRMGGAGGGEDGA